MEQENDRRKKWKKKTEEKNKKNKAEQTGKCMKTKS